MVPEPDEDVSVAEVTDPVVEEEEPDVTAFFAGHVKFHFGVVERLSDMAN